MEYNNKTHQSYVDTGIIDITIPYSVLAPEKRKREFLSRVDLSQGEIERKVTTIMRLNAKDYSTKNKEKKEYIIYLDDWFGKNWLGKKVNPVSGNIEGVYMEQEKEAVIKQNEKSGPELVRYKRSGEHLAHYIEFSKDAVDKIIANSSSDRNEIIFVLKSPPQRDHFTYDEFVNYSWEQLEDILMQPGEARAARAKRAMKGKTKLLTSNNLDFKPS